ncbi:MAG: phosphatidate cytidylyltransferase [Pseudomonadota bacterium]
MSNLQLRIVSGVVLAVVVLALTWTGGVPFRLLAAAIGALVFYEWTTVSNLRRDRPLWVAAWILVAITLVALAAGLNGYPMLILAIVPTLLLLAIGRVRELGTLAAIGMAYAVLPAVALAFLRGGDTSGLLAILYLFAVVWGTDIFAYFVGRAVGGPKLAPSISPGKTWSGAVGGAVAALVAGWIAAYFSGHPSPLLMGLLALPLSAVSQAGDLFESGFKRRFGAKDSSRLIPGHGGVMDRVDGLVAAAVALYLAGWFLAGPAAPVSGLFAI